jgi:hypothetical protein
MEPTPKNLRPGPPYLPGQTASNVVLLQSMKTTNSPVKPTQSSSTMSGVALPSFSHLQHTASMKDGVKFNNNNNNGSALRYANASTGAMQARPVTVGEQLNKRKVIIELQKTTTYKHTA